MRVPTGRMNYGFGDQDEVVIVSDASEESVRTVLAAEPENDWGNARSQWVWMRFPNGDLVLATFPQDHTYFDTEEDHS